MVVSPVHYFINSPPLPGPGRLEVDGVSLVHGPARHEQQHVDQQTRSHAPRSQHELLRRHAYDESDYLLTRGYREQHVDDLNVPVASLLRYVVLPLALAYHLVEVVEDARVKFHC